jgi:integrase
MRRDEITVHGFRSTFRDWASETTAFPHDIVEQALAHAVGSKVERAYRRGDVLAKRARLMTEWARFCTTAAPAQTSARVVALRTKVQ